MLVRVILLLIIILIEGKYIWKFRRVLVEMMMLSDDFRFQPHSIVKNPDTVGGIVEVKAGPQVGKVSWICVHGNYL